MSIPILLAQLAQSVFQLFQMGALISLMNRFVDGAWLYEQARKWGFKIDIDLMKYAEKIYDILVQIIKGTLFTPEIVNGLMTRMYLLIGILIFFRIAITMIKYIVSPETFLDDKAGAGSLVKRVVLGVIIIVATPLIFNTASRLQTAIIEDHIIERIILPKEAYNKLVDSNVNTGKRIAMITHQGFFNWNNSIPISNYSNLWNSYSRIVLYEDLLVYQNIDINKHEGDARGTIFNDSMYVFNYTPIIATLAVGYILFTFIKYAMEIALRAFKLVFLQLISPFVIINYMLNPASEETMRKWVRTTVSTYVVMFIRVMTLWFVALIAYYMQEGVPSGSDGVTALLYTKDPLVKAVIILALFAFLKDLPKLLSEMLNLDLQENETISGLMRQGFGIAKGFAMGKIGMSFAKQQLTANAIGAGLGGVAGGLSGIANGEGWKGKAIGAMNGIGEMSTPLVGNFGHAVSSSMSSTILSPISNQASLAQSNWSRNIGVSEKTKSAETKEQTKKENVEDFMSKNSFRTANSRAIKFRNSAGEELTAYMNTYKYRNGQFGSAIYYGLQGSIDANPTVYQNVTSNGTYNLSGGASNPVIQTITQQINRELFNNQQVVSVNEVAQRFETTCSDHITQVSQSDIVSVSEDIRHEYANNVTPISTDSTTSSYNASQSENQSINDSVVNNHEQSNNATLLRNSVNNSLTRGINGSSINRLRARRDNRFESGNLGRRNRNNINQ